MSGSDQTVVVEHESHLARVCLNRPRKHNGMNLAMLDAVNDTASTLAKDRDGDLVFMAKSPWDVGYQEEKNPELKFSATKER